MSSLTDSGKRVGPGLNGGSLPARKGADMADKSPRKTASKKSGKTIKEKRQAKKEKQQPKSGLVS
jgi:hypothetical protein